MALVTAARWDIRWERGAFWQARLVRRDATTKVIIGIAAPCVLELRHTDMGSDEPPVLQIPATIADDASRADLLVTETQTADLPRDRYQHRVVVTDLVTNRPMIMLRGYVTINDRVGD